MNIGWFLLMIPGISAVAYNFRRLSCLLNQLTDQLTHSKLVDTTIADQITDEILGIPSAIGCVLQCNADCYNPGLKWGEGLGGCNAIRYEAGRCFLGNINRMLVEGSLPGDVEVWMADPGKGCKSKINYFHVVDYR